MSQQQLKKYGTTFHFASRFLTAKQMDACAILYGICREIDDIADLSDDPQQARETLCELKQALQERDLDHPLAWRALTLTPAINIDVLIELIDGVIQDTDRVCMQDEAELMQYCYRVAGTVGLMMCDIFEVLDPQARHHAIDLGIAMQLTNISRDVYEDANARRRYLPASLVGSLSPEQILNPDSEQAKHIQTALQYLLEQADLRYQSGFMGLAFLPIRARFAIFIAGLIYQDIGLIIKHRDYNIWLPRAYTSKTRKLSTSLRGLITFICKRKYHHYRGHHNAALHRGLDHSPGVHWA